MPYYFLGLPSLNFEAIFLSACENKRCGQTKKDTRKKSNFEPEYGINVIDTGFILNGAQIIEFSATDL